MVNIDNWPKWLQPFGIIGGTLWFIGVLFLSWLSGVAEVIGKWLLPVLLVVSSVSAAPPEFPGMRFLGCFEAREVDPSSSIKRLGGGNCVAVFDGPDTLWLSSQKGRYLAPFKIPEVLSKEMPTWNAVRQAHDLPVKVSRFGDWIQTYNEAEVYKFIPPQAVDCRGIIKFEGKWLSNLHWFYNAVPTLAPSVFYEDRFLRTDPLVTNKELAIWGNFTAGYVGVLPDKWAGKLGTKVFCGNHSLQGTGSAFLGPAFIKLDPRTGAVKPILHPKRSHWRYVDPDTGAWHRQADSGNLTQLQADRAKYDIDYAGRITGAVAVEDSLIYVGVEGLGKGWYGPPSITIGDKTYIDFGTTFKGYHNESRGWVLHVYSMEIVEKCNRGELEPWQAEASAITVRFKDLVTSQPVGDTPIGIAVDHSSGRVAVVVPLKLSNKTETTPLVLLYEAIPVPPKVLFQDLDGAVGITVDGEKATPASITRLRTWLQESDPAKDLILQQTP